MSDILSGRVSKHRRDRRVKNCTVLRMMAIMQEGNNEVPKEFLETGRTGRRNAMPDILQAQGVEASSADLPNRLQQLGTSDVATVAAGPSNSDVGVQKPQDPRPAQTQTQS